MIKFKTVPIVITLALALLVPCFRTLNVSANEQQDIKVLIVCKGLFDDGIEVTYDSQKPFRYNSDIMIPVNPTMRWYRAKVNFFERCLTDPPRVDIRKNGSLVTFYEGKAEYQTLRKIREDGLSEIIKHPMDNPPQIVNGSFCIPLKNIVEVLDGTIYWDNKTLTATMVDNKGYMKPELIVTYNEGYMVTIRNKYDTPERTFRFVCSSNPGLNRWHTRVYSTWEQVICNEDEGYNDDHHIHAPHREFRYDEDLYPGMVLTYNIYEKLPDDTEREVDPVTVIIPNF